MTWQRAQWNDGPKKGEQFWIKVNVTESGATLEHYRKLATQPIGAGPVAEVQQLEGYETNLVRYNRDRNRIVRIAAGYQSVTLLMEWADHVNCVDYDTGMEMSVPAPWRG